MMSEMRRELALTLRPSRATAGTLRRPEAAPARRLRLRFRAVPDDLPVPVPLGPIAELGAAFDIVEVALDSGQKVEVTGSLIKRADRETPSVVQTITSEQIKQSGYASVEELMRTLGVVDDDTVDLSKVVFLHTGSRNRKSSKTGGQT